MEWVRLETQFFHDNEQVVLVDGVVVQMVHQYLSWLAVNPRPPEFLTWDWDTDGLVPAKFSMSDLARKVSFRVMAHPVISTPDTVASLRRSGHLLDVRFVPKHPDVFRSRR